MTDKLLEQVSALADDELNAREAELLLSRMQRDGELRDAWERYQMIGEALRGALAPVHHHDFAAGVADAIGQNSAPSERSLFHRALRPVAGFAVAASVAVLAVFTLQLPQDRAPSEVVPRGDSVPLAVPRLQAQTPEFSGVRSQALQDQLRGYLLNHSEHVSNPRIRGVMPYVQIAAHDTRPVETVEADEPGRDPRN